MSFSIDESRHWLEQERYSDVPHDKRVMTVTEASEILGVTVQTVRRWLHDELLVGFQTSTGIWLLDTDSVMEFADKEEEVET